MILHLNDIEFYYEVYGEGAPVVLLHGLALDGSIWKEVANLYGDQARFILPDLRGHGRSGIGRADGSIEQFADDLVRLADHLGIERFTLAGHSMGGYISLAFAERHPQRLAGLIMVTSNARADTPEKKKMRLLEADETLIVGSSTLAESLAQKLSKSAEIQRLTYQILRKTDPEGIVNVQRAIAQRPNRLEVIRNLEVPFLAVAGKDDQIVEPEAAIEMADASRKGKAVVLPGVGHMPMLEAPTALGALIISML